MRVFYKTDRINQLDEVQEILIKDNTIEFVLFNGGWIQKIDLQDFYVCKGSNDVKTYFSTSDGRVQSWYKLEEGYPVKFNVNAGGSYLFGCKSINKNTTESIQITELFPEAWY